jgi:peptidyl-prolyl cis-trans isomerase B (cyclophilin B)
MNRKLSSISLLLVFILIFSAGCGLIRQKPASPEENPIAIINIKGWGKVRIELYPEHAPNTVYNFIELANSGFYDGLTFHRVIAGFVIQGGDPLGDGTGGPGYSIKGEFSNNGFKNKLMHEKGVISMARNMLSYDSAGSQFFITVEALPDLDGDYAVGGQVIDGMALVEDISKVQTNPKTDKPLDDVIIRSIEVETFGKEYPEAEKIYEDS